MKEDIIKLLEYYGYKANETEGDIIDYVLERSRQYIKNFCNISVIPKELKPLLKEMATGEFLQLKMLTNPEGFEGLDFEAEGIKSISEGDVSISFNSGTEASAVAKYTALIDRLRCRDDELIAFRRLRW